MELAAGPLLLLSGNSGYNWKEDALKTALSVAYQHCRMKNTTYNVCKLRLNCHMLIAAADVLEPYQFFESM